MITSETIALCEDKAVQAIASVIHDIAGPDVEGETPEQRVDRYNAAGRFLYDLLVSLAQVRASMITLTEQAAAATETKQ